MSELLEGKNPIEILTGKDAINLLLVYPSHVRPSRGIINWKSNIIDEVDTGIMARLRKTATGLRIVVGSTSDIQKAQGDLSTSYFALVDVNQRSTMSIEAGAVNDPKHDLKVDALGLVAFWKARAVTKRDYMLLAAGLGLGAFLPFFLKWVAAMFGKVAPW